MVMTVLVRVIVMMVAVGMLNSAGDEAGEVRKTMVPLTLMEAVMVLWGSPALCKGLDLSPGRSVREAVFSVSLEAHGFLSLFWLGLCWTICV